MQRGRDTKRLLWRQGLKGKKKKKWKEEGALIEGVRKEEGARKAQKEGVRKEGPTN